MDSVSTKFMKSFGYEGVNTFGTEHADTRYGTVIYDLKEESIIVKEITDEMLKQKVIAGDIAGVIAGGTVEDFTMDDIERMAERNDVQQQYNEELTETAKLQQQVNNTSDNFDPSMAGKNMSEIEGSDGDTVGDSDKWQGLAEVLGNITYKTQIVQKHDAPDSEKKAALIDIEALKGALDSIVYNVKIVTDDTNKNANKIALDDSSLEATLKRCWCSALLSPRAILLTSLFWPSRALCLSCGGLYVTLSITSVTLR
jgi:hypothetical protein